MGLKSLQGTLEGTYPLVARYIGFGASFLRVYLNFELLV